MTKLLAGRGVHRCHMQVISKLKTLRKQYLKYHQQKTRCGIQRVDWLFYDLCHRAFSNAPTRNLVKRQRKTSPPLTPGMGDYTPTPSPPAPFTPTAKVAVSLWDEVDDRDINKHLGPVKAGDEDEQDPKNSYIPLMPHTQFQQRKGKKTVMQQVSTLVSATVVQLGEMDAAMQAQEDARLQRLRERSRTI